ncbi:MAG: hypothetical protein HYU80_03755, partial [Candidatus Blackburnbacteria bacterium]|nr:hypothetical protein [Candidatus Blackburnbacteria bacterium]
MPTILNIDPELLKKYQEEIEKVHSHATAKRKLSSLRRFFGWAEAKGHVPEGQLSVLSDRLSDTSRSVISSSVLADRQKTGNGEFPWLKVSGVAFGAFTTVVLTVFLARSIPGSLLLNLRGLAQTVQKVERVKVEEVVKVDQVAQESTPTPTQLPQPTQPPQQPQIPSSSDALTAKLLELIGENPAIKALGGVLDIASQGLTLRSYPTSDGDITLSPDGNGQVNIRSSTTTNDSLNIQNANLTTGNLISGYVGNNGTNYNLLYLSSGPIEQERFSVDSQGNTYIGGDTTTEGDMNVSGTLTASSANINGALSINRVTRISSLGRLSSITGYYQDSGLFEIDQGSPDSARITKSPTTAQGSATSDVLTLTLDETNTTGSAQDTLVLSRKNAGTGGYALDVRNGDVNFTGALNVSGATTLSSTISVAGDTTLTGDLAVNGGDITTTATTFNLLNSTATTINFAGAATTFNLADSTNTKTIDIGGVTSDGTDTINIATNGTTNADTITIGNSNASTTVAITGGDDWNMAGTGVLTMSASASQTTAIVVTDTDYTNALSIGDNNITGTTANIDLTNFDVTGSTGDITTAGDLAVNGGDITTTAATFNLVNAATTLNIGSTSVTRAINLGTGTLADTINIGNGGTTADLIYIGNSATANTITIGSTSSTTVSITDDNWNITAAGLANFVSVGAATPGTGAFTTLTSNNTTTIGNGSGIITSIGNSGGAAAINLTSGTGSQTFTSSVATGTTTSSAFVFTDSALTSGTLLYLTSTATSGKSIDLNIANTSGTVVNGAYGGAKILGGALIGVSLDLSTNVTATGQNITGISLTTNPAVTNTGAGTYAYKGVVISAGAITQNTEAGTNTSTGLDVTNPNITQTTGTITANGLLVTTGSITTGGTQNGVNVSASGVGAGALNAINIGTITGSGGTETAINIAAGWDTDINATTSLEIGIGGTNEVTLTSSAFSPTTTDGNALGTTSLMWSDLFLASGAVINFNNGDVTVTHAADSLAITGGNVGIGTTSPSQKLHVEGQCVAKGTRIRRRRRRKTMDDGEIEDGNLKMEDGEWKENNLSSTLNPQNTTL